MFQNKTRVSNTFERIKNDFYKSRASNVNIVSDDKLTRKGVALKTIILLLVVISCATFGTLKEINKTDIYLAFGFFCFIASTIFYYIGIFSVTLSKIFSFLYSITLGYGIGIFLNLLKGEYEGFFPIVFSSLLFTFLIFIFMSHLYYKGILLATYNFKKNMFRILIFVIISQMISLLLACFGNYTMENLIHQSVLTIPINIFLLIFTSLILILHFDYVEQMIFNGMPKKYEYQLSLGFASLLVSVFLRILITILSIVREKDR